MKIIASTILRQYSILQNIVYDTDCMFEPGEETTCPLCRKVQTEIVNISVCMFELKSHYIVDILTCKPFTIYSIQISRWHQLLFMPSLFMPCSEC